MGPARAVLSHLLDQQEFRKNNLSYWSQSLFYPQQ
jgi:hypothetical protein